MNKVSGETKSGFKFEIEEEMLDNMEILDYLSDADDGNSLAFPKLLNTLLGKDQKKRLYNHLRTEKGNVPSEKVLNELHEIFEICNAKNS